MEACKYTHLYTHLNLFLWFLGSSCQVHSGIQELSQDFSVLLEPPMTDTAGSPFTECPAVTHNTVMNLRHMNKMLTIMAFTQLCLWDAFASYSDCNSALPFVLPTYLAASEETHEHEFHIQLYRACIYQLEQVQICLIHEKSLSLPINWTTAGCTGRS